jgi:hypothetical protein
MYTTLKRNEHLFKQAHEFHDRYMYMNEKIDIATEMDMDMVMD